MRKRRSFDCAARDETASGFAQDDNFFLNQAAMASAFDA
jgi:hypothetical protein